MIWKFEKRKSNIIYDLLNILYSNKLDNGSIYTLFFKPYSLFIRISSKDSVSKRVDTLIFFIFIAMYNDIIYIVFVGK